MIEKSNELLTFKMLLWLLTGHNNKIIYILINYSYITDVNKTGRFAR